MAIPSPKKSSFNGPLTLRDLRYEWYRNRGWSSKNHGRNLTEFSWGGNISFETANFGVDGLLRFFLFWVSFCCWLLLWGFLLFIIYFVLFCFVCSSLYISRHDVPCRVYYQPVPIKYSNVNYNFYYSYSGQSRWCWPPTKFSSKASSIKNGANRWKLGKSAPSMTINVVFQILPLCSFKGPLPSFNSKAFSGVW